MHSELLSGPGASIHAWASGSRLLQMLVSLLQSASLAPGGQKQAAGALLAAEHAAALVRHVAAVRPDGVPSGGYMGMLLHATALLSVCIQKVGVGQQSEAAGSSAAAAEAAAGDQAEVTAAGWHAAALLPELTTALVALEASLRRQGAAATAGSGMRGLQQLSGAVANLRYVLFMVSLLQLEDCSPSQTCAWLAAASAGLQLLPCLSRLIESGGQDSIKEGLMQFRGGLLSVFLNQLPLQLEQLLAVLQQRQQHGSTAAALPPDEAAAWDSLPAQLWGLHTTLCRLTAALSVPGAQLRLLGMQLAPSQWRPLLSCLSALLIVNVESCCHAQRVRAAQVSRRRLHILPTLPRCAGERLRPTAAAAAG